MCCFFHFVQNIRKKATPIITKIKKTVGESAAEFELAEQTKRRLMMLPLLPEERITSEVIDIILADWKAGVPDDLQTVFNGLATTVLKTYVGTPPGSNATSRPRFPPHIWSVSAQSVRTNNGAESLHSELNPKSKGMLSLHSFLAAIEGQMDRARDRIATGCKPHARTAVPVKNSALAVELQDLLGGKQDVLTFLDNCGLIISFGKVKDVKRFIERRVPRIQDSDSSMANGEADVQVAKNLYLRLHPGGQFTDDEILNNVTTWAFQDLPPADVPVRNSDEASDLSLVETEARTSFLEICEDLKKKRLQTHWAEGQKENTDDENDEQTRTKKAKRKKERKKQEVRMEIPKRKMEVVPPLILSLHPSFRMDE